MSAKELARCGVLAASAVVLLYIGGMMPWMAPALCVAAGVCSAVPLMRHNKVRDAVLMYLSASVLSALIVPRKGVVMLYFFVCGLYPVIKYGIECRVPRRVQMVGKLLYCNIVLAAVLLMIRYGLLPAFAKAENIGLLPVWVGANACFLVYDIGLSGVIAQLRRTLPPE